MPVTTPDPSESSRPSPSEPGGLAAAARERGTAVASAANRPVRLDEPGVLWVVEEGALDVFLVELSGDEVRSSLKHIVRASVGQAVFGFPLAASLGSGSAMTAVAKGLPGCRLRRLDLASASAAGVERELAEQVDEWVSTLFAALLSDLETTAPVDRWLAAGDTVALEASEVVSAKFGTLWLDARGCSLVLLGSDEVAPAGGILVPVTPAGWAETTAPGEVAGVSSLDLVSGGRLEPSLSSFHAFAASFAQFSQRLLILDEVNQQRSRAAARDERFERARRGLFDVFAGGSDGPSALSMALEVVGDHEGIGLRIPKDLDLDQGNLRMNLARVAAVSGVRCRVVNLDRNKPWWRGDSGALLTARIEDMAPVALLPGPAGYRAVDPVSGASVRLNADRVALYGNRAWSFARSLPHGRAATKGDLVRCAGRRVGGDVLRFLAAGLAAAGFSVVPALVMAVIADSALPSGDEALLRQLSLGLVAAAVGAALLGMLRGAALLRIEGRVGSRLASAAWDRVLRFKPDFFRVHAAGELVERIAVFESLRSKVSGLVGAPVLSVIFLFPMFFAVFAYDALLGWFGVAVGGGLIGVAVWFALAQYPLQRRMLAASRQLSASLLQFVLGIAKIRTAGAERAAFTAWAKQYREQQAAAVELARLNGWFAAFSASLPLAVTALLFAVFLWGGLSSGVAGFLAAYGVSMVFFGAVAQLGTAFQTVAQLAPELVQIDPLLREKPRAVPGHLPRVDLDGRLEFDTVSFRYQRGAPLVVDGVSLYAAPGEFVALVGETGCGKSTLLRLALGLHDPSSGAVRYDGRDLASVDSASVRRQVGVVMQNAALQQGTILHNIIGVGSAVDTKAVWKAVTQAAIADDVAAMPMGLYTPVSESNASYSGGQAQRIMIAAALVRQPRILFLDEATSWLDRTAQSAVMDAIEALTITRIVIAHRLSTIRAADRIYVLHQGRVVQTGTFDELVEQEGRFRELMLRQMI